ncbi:recombinase family protein [Natronococcus roseus]|uniref:recombinase family protein n=1 Tax=Natronococcus roseus TaxID=1052014 RepID=UPI00374CE8BB
MNCATYIRASTDNQTDAHQRKSIDEWLQENGIDLADVDRYADLGQSGASDDREQFTELLEALEAGEYTHVVCWEISRLSRKGATLQRFFDVCEDTETTVVITDGSVEKVTPDGTGRFVADIIGMVYQQERRTLIRRIEAGQRRAQRQGKWLGQVPIGFRRDDEGYLQPIIDPDHDAGETGYLELRDALERIDDGESYRSVAEGLPVTRQSLSNIHQNSDRREWYLEATADNDAVHAALGSVRTVPADRSLVSDD